MSAGQFDDVSAAIASFSQSEELLQISPESGYDLLGDKNVFPLFGRVTVPSCGAGATSSFDATASSAADGALCGSGVSTAAAASAAASLCSGCLRVGNPDCESTDGCSV